MSQIFKAGTQSALPGTSQGNEFGINGLHLFVSCWCFILSAAQLQAGKVRQTAAAAQLPASPECYKRNCLQRGNWHTHIHTYWLQPNTPVSILLLSYENLYTNFIFLWLFFFFFYLQLFIAEKNLSSFGAFESFSKAFFKIKSKWWLTIAAFLRSSKVCEHESIT